MNSIDNGNFEQNIFAFQWEIIFLLIADCISSCDRYLEADKYFQSLNASKKLNRRTSNDFAVVVITKKRFVCEQYEFDCEPHYLQQTVAALDSESKWNSVDSIPIVVCSVDAHWERHLDLNAIANYFSIIFRYNISGVEEIPSNKGQETSDYAYCLEQASLRFGTTKHLIAIEDDAVVFENFFSTLHSIVKNRIETTYTRGEKIVLDKRKWCWMKLYFPEFWSGFAWDANRLWELVWITVCGGMIGSILAFLTTYVKRSNISAIWWTCNGALYLLLVALVVSRPTWLEMRRIHVALMQVTPDSGCCSTVAVLYPMDEIPKIVEYLRSAECFRCPYGVDLAIRDYKDKFEMVGLLVQPNLARHVGLHSTVSAAYKDPVQMLFYDFLSF